jgi:alpha/beta superfamily hydrolase
MTEQRTLSVDDGVELEAELAVATGTPRAAAVLCHPHPQYGGTMRSIVISALFEALPARGVTCLRFNFRGVEDSTGFFDEGRGERADALTALRELASEVSDTLPLVVAGWSFGADVTLSITDERVRAWLAIAPPLHYTGDRPPVADDARAKHHVLAEHDEVRSPETIERAVADWQTTTLEIVPGASHFFVGRTDHVIAAADRLIGEIAR